MRSLFLLPAVAMLSIAASACSPATTASQAKVAIKSDTDLATRQDALNVMAAAICDRYDSCKQLGEDKKYSTKEDCLSKERAVWANVWTEDKCGGEGKGVVVGKIDECKNRAGTWACGDSVLDFGGLVSHCGAGDVCR